MKFFLHYITLHEFRIRHLGSSVTGYKVSFK